MKKILVLTLMTLCGLFCQPLQAQVSQPVDTVAAVDSTHHTDSTVPSVQTPNSQADSCRIKVDTLAGVSESLADTVFVKENDADSTVLMSGIYLVGDDDSTLIDIEPEPFTLRKGGSGSLEGVATGVGGTLLGIALGGVGGLLAGKMLSSSSVKTEQIVLPGPSSGTLLTNVQALNPRFTFVFDERSDSLQPDSTQQASDVMAGAATPNDFQCVKLDSKKDRRTLPKKMQLSTIGLTTGNMSLGGKSLVNFQVKDLGEGEYEVSFPEKLEPGEYCFLFKDLGQSAYVNHRNAFAFTVPSGR